MTPPSTPPPPTPACTLKLRRRRRPLDRRAENATFPVRRPCRRRGHRPRRGAGPRPGPRRHRRGRSRLPRLVGLLPQERGAALRRWHDADRSRRARTSPANTREQGKPLAESRGEIDYAASFVEFYAEEARRPNIEGVTSHLHDAEVELWRQPAGVAALVTPWNFPCAMITRKAAAALAAGCTVVIHPSHETPFSALALAELAERAGIPAGVFNVVTGDAPTIVGAWTRTPGSASSPSPARPRSAGSSTASPPTP